MAVCHLAGEPPGAGMGRVDPTNVFDALADNFSLNVTRTRDPVWNEEFKLNVGDPASQFLQVCVSFVCNFDYVSFCRRFVLCMICRS